MKNIITAYVFGAMLVGLLIGYLVFPETITKTVKECDEPIDYRANEPNTKACIDNGGVPIYSAWNGALARCEYKPEK